MGKIFTRDGKHGIDYIDGRGKRVRRMIAFDLSVAQTALGKAVGDAERVRNGVLAADPREARKPFQSHLVAYLSDMRRKGRDQMYCYIVRRHLEAAAKAQKWDCLASVTSASIGHYLRKLSDEGLKPKTLNAHRSDLNAFFGWCVRHMLMEANPCLQVAKTTVKGEKTRRALGIDEIRRLLAASPTNRRVCYQFLAFTGLRRGEAKSLTWAHLHLDVANPFVELPSSITKSGKAESVPMLPEVVGALREHRGDREEGDPVFDSIPSMELFRKDLKAAKIDEVDSRGRQVVLHSLRHSLCTLLAVNNVPMPVAQRIMRHRDIRLTAQTYTDEALLPMSAAMASLPTVALHAARA